MSLEKKNVKNSDEFWMRKAIQYAFFAQNENEVPVGAVLVLDNKIIGFGSNRCINEHDPSAHAEILALRMAGKYLKNYRLLNSTMYVTLEPCSMCAAAMIHARIQRLVFGAFDLKTGAAGSVCNIFEQKNNHQVNVSAKVLENNCATLLSQFFKKRRCATKKVNFPLQKTQLK